MKFQYSAATMLLATMFFSIACCSICYSLGTDFRLSPNDVWAKYYVPCSIVWVPLVFIGYAAGRKTLTIGIVLAFAATQAFAMLVIHALARLMR
jgi:hypothetical protein